MPPATETPPTSTAGGPATPASEAGFDQVLAQLRAVVERLEGGNLTLEQSLAAFEEGVRLSRNGARILDAAEHRVEILTRDEGGADRAVPFGGGGGGGGESDRGHR
jgi:exodeoxyribonuclease VII small subunit